MTVEAISPGTAVPGRFNLTGQVPGERSDKLQHLALQVGGWANIHKNSKYGTFQGLYGTDEETGQVPQDGDIMFTDYQS